MVSRLKVLIISILLVLSFSAAYAANDHGSGKDHGSGFVGTGGQQETSGKDHGVGQSGSSGGQFGHQQTGQTGSGHRDNQQTGWQQQDNPNQQYGQGNGYKQKNSDRHQFDQQPWLQPSSDQQSGRKDGNKNKPYIGMKFGSWNDKTTHGVMSPPLETGPTGGKKFRNQGGFDGKNFGRNDGTNNRFDNSQGSNTINVYSSSTSSVGDVYGDDYLGNPVISQDGFYGDESGSMPPKSFRANRQRRP